MRRALTDAIIIPLPLGGEGRVRGESVRFRPSRNPSLEGRGVLLGALTTLAVALLLDTPAQAGRIWFSLSGVPENQPIAGTPPEYFLEQNPVIDAGAGEMRRLYVWGTHEDGGVLYTALVLDINIYPHAGDVSIVDSRFYNYVCPSMPWRERWDLVVQGILTPTRVDDAAMYVVVNGWGLSYYAEYFHDSQYDPQTNCLLLGYLDLLMTPDARGEIFFGLESYTVHPPLVHMYFGWGDGPVPTWPHGQQSTLPDAYIVPEPATAALLVCVAPALLRRRRARQARRRPAGSK